MPSISWSIFKVDLLSCILLGTGADWKLELSNRRLVHNCTLYRNCNMIFSSHLHCQYRFRWWAGLRKFRQQGWRIHNSRNIYIDAVGLCRGGHILKEMMSWGTVIQRSWANITRIIGTLILLKSAAFAWVGLFFFLRRGICSACPWMGSYLLFLLHYGHHQI